MIERNHALLRRRLRRTGATLGLLGAFLVTAAAARAQDSGPVDGEPTGDGSVGSSVSAPAVKGPRAAAPYLPPEHWALNALRRLDGTGLLAHFDPGLPGITRLDALHLFRSALAAAGTDRTDMVPLIEGYLERLGVEFPGALRRADGAAGGGPIAGRRAVMGGYESDDGVMLTTEGTPPLSGQWWEVPAGFGESRQDVIAGASLSGYWGQHLAAEVGATIRGEQLRLQDSYLVGAAGPVAAWAGRRHVRIGADGAGIIVSGVAPMDGGGIGVDAFRLPGFLSAIGDVRVSTALGQLSYAAPHEDPWLWVARITVQPHPRLLLGLNRGAMAVPVDGGLDQTLKHAGYILIGKHLPGDDNWRDNQMASVDAQYRPPLGTVPVTLYVEWGLDDSAGSWRDVPGIVAGARLAALPGLPWLGAAVERTHFAERCCGNIWWYRHSGFVGGWTDGRRPLGHPLGGHGDEWSARLDGTLLGGRALARARLYHRDRGDENLFAPTFQGGSVGGSLDFSAMVLPYLDIGLELSYEDGDQDWSRTGASVDLRLVF